MPDYYSPGPNQSGSVQSGLGSIMALDSGNEDSLDPTWLDPGVHAHTNWYLKNLKGTDILDASKAFKSAYEANDPLAKENASFYSGIAKGILGNNASQTDVYERMRSGNLASLGDQFKNILDYGLASQKARLAAGGYGNQGPSAYDRILNSTMAGANMAPVLSSIYGNLGRDASSAYGADRAWDQYRMNQFAKDPLTGYADAAAYRKLVPVQTSRGLINMDMGTLKNITDVIKNNFAGYKLDPGLASKFNNLAAGVMNMSRFGGELMSTYGGGMGGGIGGMGGGMGGGGAGSGQQMSPEMAQALMASMQRMNQNPPQYGYQNPTGNPYGGVYGAETSPMQFYNPNYGMSYGVDVPYTNPNLGGYINSGTSLAA